MNQQVPKELQTFKVAAVVVTYNRKDLLRKCLQALLRQTRPPDEIIVIDNASTDGTDQIVPKEFSQVTYVRLPDNIGGAGGFHEGMKIAYEKGYDWIWVMDDDGLPEADCLEKLLKVGERGFYYVAPNLVDNDGVSHFKMKFDFARTDVINFCGGPFNAILLNRELVRAVGYPMKKFFIWGDEVEYCNRIVEAGFPVVTVKNAIHHHKRTTINYKTCTRGYFYVRNKIYVYRLFKGVYRSKKVYLIGRLIEVARFLLYSALAGNFSQVWEGLKGFVHGWLDDLLEAQKEAFWWGIH